MQRTHYQTLHVNSQATQAEIKKAYRQLAKQFHPDICPNPQDPEQIVEINAAYEVLGDRKRRQVYDQHLALGAFPPDGFSQTPDSEATTPSQRVYNAQAQYRQQRQTQEDADLDLKNWVKGVYQPVSRLILQIFKPLKQEIRELSADPFDDQLMTDFQAYLETSKQKFAQAERYLRSQPNPPRVAGVAAHLYYALNHVSDALEELETFTLNYDDHCLHNGQELFRMAQALRLETQTMLQQIR